MTLLLFQAPTPIKSCYGSVAKTFSKERTGFYHVVGWSFHGFEIGDNGPHYHRDVLCFPYALRYPDMTWKNMVMISILEASGKCSNFCEISN